MIKQLRLTTAIGTIALAGCTTTDQAQRIQSMTDDQRLEQQANQHRVERLPSWVTAPTETSVNHLAAVESGTGSGPVKAINDAKTLARFELARKFHESITGQIRMIVNSSGYVDRKDKQKLIDGFVDQVQLRGVETDEQTVIATPKGFKAFTQMSMDRNAIDRTIMDTRDSLGDELFQRLMERRRDSGDSASTDTRGTNAGAASSATATSSDVQETAQHQPETGRIEDVASDVHTDVTDAVTGGGDQ